MFQSDGDDQFRKNAHTGTWGVYGFHKPALFVVRNPIVNGAVNNQQALRIQRNI